MVLRPPALFEIDGQAVNIASTEQAIAAIVDRLSQPSSFMVCTLNLDHLVKLRENPAFRRAYGKAAFVTADGFPIVTLARMDQVLLERTTGSDLVLPLCRAAAAHRIPVFLFGTTPEALSRAAQRLTRDVPDLDIRGSLAPPRDFSEHSAAGEEAIEAIARSGARICFIALGAPKQEIFAATAVDRTAGIAFVSVGGGLDFLAGLQKRSPPFLQRLNLEWAWRLGTDPVRLTGRYVKCGMLFLQLLVRRLVKGPGKRASA
jgi:exopolysaccharide biosynthesis WecB/TagA/CpsF family protein